MPSEASLRDVPEVSGAANNVVEPPNSPLQAHLQSPQGLAIAPPDPSPVTTSVSS